MSFETNVTLGIEVDSGELRSAKRAIEDELGDVTVGVSGGGASARAAGGGSAGGGASGQRSRRLFRWARQRTGYMEETVELLTNIEESLDDGGVLGSGANAGGGGGGGGGLIGRIIGGVGTGAGIGGGLGLFQALRSGIGSLGGITGPSAAATAVLSPFFGNRKISGQDDFGPVARGLSERAIEFGGPGGLLNLGQGGNEAQIRRIEGFDTTPSGGSAGRGPGGQLEPLVLNEPPWLEALERITNRNLRLVIESDTTVDVNVDNLSQELRNLEDNVKQDIERRIQAGLGEGPVR